eukprot:CAMPEP_0176376218 /NCGR_PEP_ID=MMETSP0126-20121128/28032_1 /TAXON_ID=141414 ORGANISM="Strombidinopsis acuminatum, Strain SPMC142" /NCGR_SAMPLE_ID=MMETSP0126 /ASSEMBLY_ACC=CAM_ASM_000229 /LENGTH=129 /DNA_ID=CAMNT_0017737563 /DNA_START=980 /DNA_END=1372 /DNA_ORIENTATION=-
MCPEQEFNRTWYLSLILGAGILTLISIMHPKYDGTEYKPMRTMLFTAVGFSAIIPMIHMKYMVDPAHYVAINLDNIFLGGFFYVLGATMYAFRLPERFFPGKFDICGQSHHIFHTFVVIAAVIHFNNSL